MTFSRAENGSTEFRALSALRENLIGMRKSEGAAAFRLPNAAPEIENGFSRGIPSALANENLSSHAHTSAPGETLILFNSPIKTILASAVWRAPVVDES